MPSLLLFVIWLWDFYDYCTILWQAGWDCKVKAKLVSPEGRKKELHISDKKLQLESRDG